MSSKATAVCAMGAAVIVLVSAGFDASRAGVATPECITNATRAKTETTVYNIDVNSMSYANVPATAIPFTQARAGCVLVMFSSTAETNTTQIRLRAVIDGGAYVAEPPFVGFTAFQDNYAAARAFNFVFKRVPAGAHTVAIQAGVAFADGTARLGERSTIVFYRR